MSSTPDPVTSSDGERRPCENCKASLRGEYCHACGQSMHNPIRHAGHALEEVFESFWHLDGRVFRTLRDLPVPARVACNYIAGHRARYIAPLRLFVILSVLTFFIGRMTVDVSNEVVQFDNDDSAISTATTVAEVERIRDRQLKDLHQAEIRAARVPGANAGLITARVEIQGQAAARMAELRRQAKASPSPANAPSEPSRRTDGPTSSGAADKSAGKATQTDPAEAKRFKPEFNGQPWHEQTNPLVVTWLPAFANRWLNHKIGRLAVNGPRLQHDAGLRERVVFGSVPTALFVLMPVFALLLKLAYIGKRRLYLEHLVVALYSHAFLLLALLTVFVLVGLENWVTPQLAGAGTTLGWLQVAVWWWMPIYLLIMQKRVYGQGWLVSALKYFVLGTIYLMLVLFAALIAGAAGVAKL